MAPRPAPHSSCPGRPPLPCLSPQTSRATNQQAVATGCQQVQWAGVRGYATPSTPNTIKGRGTSPGPPQRLPWLQFANVCDLMDGQMTGRMTGRMDGKDDHPRILYK
jgi:hypothetical protein